MGTEQIGANFEHGIKWTLYLVCSRHGGRGTSGRNIQDLGWEVRSVVLELGTRICQGTARRGLGEGRGGKEAAPLWTRNEPEDPLLLLR